MSQLRTSLFLAALTALLIVAGYLIAGKNGVLPALLFSGAGNLFAYWFSDKMVLSMYGAKEVSEQTAPDLYNLTAQLATSAGLPMPKLYIMQNDQPNAFATGRNPEHAAVAVTTGLMRVLTHEELAGVIAHELAHIKNRDTLTMTITATLAGAIGALANIGLFFGSSNNRNNPMGAMGVIFAAILAPLAAAMVQFAISRAREYEADKVGAKICRHPLWLAEALRKISSHRAPNFAAERNPATAHMFIVNPLNAYKMDALFSTHPPVALRIQKLESMAQGGDTSAATIWR